MATDFDDVFQSLRADLEAEGQDLEWSMANPTLEDIRAKPRPQQISRCVLFVSDKVESKTVEFLLDKEPYFLLTSSPTFRFAFFRELLDYVHPFDPFELEELTMLSYQMSILHLHKQLWTTYLQSGTGELERSHPSRRHDEKTELHHWPTYLHSFTIARAYVKRMTSEAMDHEMRIVSVKEYLSYLEEQLHDYATQYEAMKNNMPLYTPTLTYRIDECVRKHALSAVHIYFDVIIALMKHDYMDRFMQLQYWQLKPIPEQIHKANRACQLTCRNSVSGQEHYLFREDMYFKKTPKLCLLIGANAPHTIRMVVDPTLRASLLKQYTRIIDYARFDLNKVMITAAATVKKDSQRALDGFLSEVWPEERRIPEKDRFSTSMHQLIEKRQANIVDCVRVIYAQKLQFFLKTPTIIMREFFRE